MKKAFFVLVLLIAFATAGYAGQNHQAGKYQTIGWAFVSPSKEAEIKAIKHFEDQNFEAVDWMLSMRFVWDVKGVHNIKILKRDDQTKTVLIKFDWYDDPLWIYQIFIIPKE